MNKPNKVNLRKAGSAVSNIKRDSGLSSEEKKRKLDEILNAQEFVDQWNNEYVGKKGMDGKDLTSHFNNITLNDGLVIQMFMENPIKSLVKTENDEVVSIDYGIQQIDYRKRNTDVPTWGPTPFPLIDKGIIVAISPAVKSYYYQQREALKAYDKEAYDNFNIPEVGDIVYTNHFLFKDHRYYVDKQDKCKDFVKSQEELRLNNFDFLFKITNYEIESIVKADKRELLSDNKGSNIITVNSSDLNKEMLAETDGE